MVGKTTYTESIAEKILGRLVEGESLRAICRDEKMPSISTVFYWVADEGNTLNGKPFSEQYTKARQMQAEGLADELCDIADDTSKDWIETENGERFNSEHVNRSRLRIDTRKWIAERMAAKKYGAKQQLEHTSPDGSMTPKGVDVSKLSTEALAEIMRAADEQNPAD